MLYLIRGFKLVRPAKPISFFKMRLARTNFFRMWPGSGFKFETAAVQGVVTFPERKCGSNVSYLETHPTFECRSVVKRGMTVWTCV